MEKKQQQPQGDLASALSGESPEQKDTTFAIASLADLNSHRIEGFATHGNTEFSVSLYSQIHENLWTGGCPVGVVPTEFRFIVSLYPWETYKTHAHQTVLVARLYDAAEIPDVELLHALADYVSNVMAIGPTLVHCQAGLNRSGLVAALALIRSGWTPASAIRLLREKRSPAVLCNATFEKWLLARAAGLEHSAGHSDSTLTQ